MKNLEKTTFLFHATIVVSITISFTYLFAFMFSAAQISVINKAEKDLQYAEATIGTLFENLKINQNSKNDSDKGNPKTGIKPMPFNRPWWVV